MAMVSASAILIVDIRNLFKLLATERVEVNKSASEKDMCGLRVAVTNNKSRKQYDVHYYDVKQTGNSYAEEKLDVIEREAKEDNRKHAAKVAEEVAAMISRVPEYVFDAYEDGCQGDGGSLVDFTIIEKEATEENAAHIARIEADKKKQESEWNIGMRVFVPVSCRTEKCKKLGMKGTLVLVAGTKYCTVISEEGRFDLHCAAFKCSRCDGVMNAELEDYIGSGYWPGNPKTLGIFFTTSFLKLYFHLKNYLPGSSEYILLKALGAFSADAGRENTISNAFSRASRMYYYITHLADRDIKQQRKLSCRACSNKCCAVHIDGNHKLVRRKSKLKQRIKQLYKKKSSFSVKKNLRKLPVVGKLKNKIKTDSICGNSDFKAAQEVSINRKNLATTGSVMMCCIHGCLHKGVMTKGETYSHTLLLLEHIYGLQDPEHANLFIVQDVNCKLDPWLKELARLDPGRFKALQILTRYFDSASKVELDV
ncbi:hypothetical protein DAPPUDRAFT_334795 [Daphnia pulex]|uniref:CxC3 like cysteine cluster domain-containing protein n=1 Tax=Daphnia pulex TaxID=6669 RepID=E9HWE2_DAPPU|nr:hypothetical protein DAPPUDRAFT_334795 [Daphnia pulex]|eukprot:EFX63936.1 hypothetical protein DAPPUDRAFT_334795 [Daphnia pulex]